MRFQVGKVYRLQWFDPGVVTNTDSEAVDPADFTDSIGTIHGAEYRGSIAVARVRVHLFYPCTFPKQEHEDYYFVPDGCVIQASEVT